MSNFYDVCVTLILLLVNLSLRTKQGYTITIDIFFIFLIFIFGLQATAVEKYKVGWSEAWPTKEFEKFQENKFSLKSCQRFE